MASGRISLFPSFGQRYDKPNVRPAVAAYVDLARQHGLTGTELAIAFVAAQPLVGSTILGATSVAQLQTNLRAAEQKLPEAVLAGINAIHLRFTNPAP